MTLLVQKIVPMSEVHQGMLIVDKPISDCEIGDIVKHVVEVRSIHGPIRKWEGSCRGYHVNANKCYTGPVAIAVSVK